MSRFSEKLATRCPKCRLRPTLCLCSEFPELRPVRTFLRLVIHRLEGKTTTNTGLLACEALPGSKVFWRGVQSQRTEAKSFSAETFFQPETTPIFLYPAPDAQVLDAQWLSSRLRVDAQEKFTLVVPDGTWSQARKVGSRERALRDLLRVTLPLGSPSEYRLRREPHPHFVCTYEAIARALGVLEGPEIQIQMEQLFRKFIGRQLWSRGDLRDDEVLGRIPEAAKIERLRSGFPKRY